MSRVCDILLGTNGWLLGSNATAAINGASPGTVAAVTLLVPRVWMVSLSYFHDLAIMKVCRAAQLPEWDVIAVLASSWTVFLLYGRTFSNVGETFWVTAAALTAVTPSLSPVKKAAIFGAITGAAVFTRFTYLAYAFPFGVVMLLLNLNVKGHAFSAAGVISGSAVAKCFWWSGITLFAAATVAAVLAQIDTLYYRNELSTAVDDVGRILAALLGSSFSATLANLFNTLRTLGASGRGRAAAAALQDKVGSLWDRAILTPLNLFEFNSNPSNLEQFGLHPWCKCCDAL